VSAVPAPRRRSLSRRLVDWAAGFDDGEILRAAFFGMLAATVCVLVIDYRELSARDAAGAAAATAPDAPVLPAFDPGVPGGKPGPAVTTDPKLLDQKLAISLGAGGVLALTGTIDPGAADRLAAEIAVHGEYVKTVALDSPGGALEDAIAMGRLIRSKGLATSVADGAMCASSCPLVFAGGKARLAGAKAAIGVHQFYLLPATGQNAGVAALDGGKAADLAIERTQKTTADINRYLIEMGIDPALWLHALDTPPQQIYYFSAEELVHLKLVTNITN
jgi:hypothetical protein